MKLQIVNGVLVTPGQVVPGGLLISGETIERLLGPGERPEPGIEALDAGGGYILPGFIDLHTHGGGGADYADATPEAFATAARAHLRHGTTAISPTILASAPERMDGIFAAYRAARDMEGMPELLGLHMEGPYFAPSQKGAQNQKYLRDPDPAEYLGMLERAPFITRWSLAPELPGALEMALALGRRGVLASVAHTDATERDMRRAADSGFSAITHFYSCMSTIRREGGYRVPGVIEAGLLMDEFCVELIADGHHLPDSLIRLVYKVKGASRAILVTDSMRAAGLGDGPSYLGDRAENFPVIVEGGVAKLPDRSAFAGSVATADVLLRTAVGAGVPLADAVRMLTHTPAKLMGKAHEIGSLAPGKRADVVLMDGALNLVAVFARGKQIQEVG